MSRLPPALAWCLVALVMIVPATLSLLSPQLAWRQPVYIVAGFAGVVAMTALFLQPLLATGALPGTHATKGRMVHRWIGSGVVVALAVHVVGLWITSPPDLIDALLFRSPTPFSAWGVISMWAVLVAALLSTVRRRLGPRIWRLVHLTLAAIIVATAILHAVLIEGTMETYTKITLCLATALTTGYAILQRQLRRRYRI